MEVSYKAQQIPENKKAKNIGKTYTNSENKLQGGEPTWVPLIEARSDYEQQKKKVLDHTT